MKRDPEISFTQWIEEGKMLLRRRESSSWEMGDWLIRGEVLEFDPLFKKSIQVTGYTQRFLYVLKKVSETFPVHERSYTLTWTAHRELAREHDIEKRKELFETAVKERWTSGQVERWFHEHPPSAAEVKKPRNREGQYRYREVECPNCHHTFAAKDHKIGAVKQIALVKKAG